MTLPDELSELRARGKRSRLRGKTGELEVVRILKAIGYANAERTSRGTSQDQTGDIANGPAGCHLEVRYRETCSIWKWLAQAERDAHATTNLPIVVCRRSRMQWWSVMQAHELDALLQLTRVPTHTHTMQSKRLPLWTVLDKLQVEALAAIPVLRFSRVPGAWYAAAPATIVFGLLREREMS